jgi:hypothetical protein
VDLMLQANKKQLMVKGIRCPHIPPYKLVIGARARSA